MSLLNRQAARELAPTDAGALIERCERGEFRPGDALRIPAGWEAILVCRSAFSQVLREGDTRLPVKGRRAQQGELYFIRLAPAERIQWGMGGLHIGGDLCGLHGSLRLEVASSRKLLSAFMSEPMPLTPERAFDRLLEQTLDMVGSTACGLLQRSDELEGARERIAAVARDLLEEPFERYGLAVAELSVEGTYVAPGAQEV